MLILLKDKRIHSRSATDGTSATTVPSNGVYGVDDVLEAVSKQLIYYLTK